MKNKIIFDKMDLAVKKTAKHIKKTNKKHNLTDIQNKIATLFGYRHYHELRQEVIKNDYNKHGYTNLHTCNPKEIDEINLLFLEKLLISTKDIYNISSLRCYIRDYLITYNVFNEKKESKLLLDFDLHNYHLEMTNQEFKDYAYQFLENTEEFRETFTALLDLIFFLLESRILKGSFQDEFLSFIRLDFILNQKKFCLTDKHHFFDNYINKLNQSDPFKLMTEHYLYETSLLYLVKGTILNKDDIDRDYIIKLQDLKNKQITIKSHCHNKKYNTLNIVKFLNL